MIMTKSMIINKKYIQKVMLLGNLFSIPIKDVAIHPFRSRAYFTNENHQLGYIKEQNQVLQFELATAFGLLQGHFIEENIAFSIEVLGKPYDFMQGMYMVSTSPCGDIKKESLSCRFRKQEDVLFSMNLMANTSFSIHQSYLHSPRPYEDVSIQEKNDSFFLEHKMRNSSIFSIHTQVLKRDDQVHYQFGKDCFQDISFDYEPISKMIYEKDPHLQKFLNQIHHHLIFDEIDLYQNFITACLFSTIHEDTRKMLGVSQRAYQKNLRSLPRVAIQ